MPYTFAGAGILVLWGVGTVFFEAPGWIHILLSGGLALVLYGIVKPKPDATK
jgi:hypothetical protein